MSLVFSAEEAFLFGGNINPIPIVEWDGKPIGSGKVGDHTHKLKSLFEEDLRHGHGDMTQLIPLNGLE